MAESVAPADFRAAIVVEIKPNRADIITRLTED
jgi:hypothetical protein